MAKLTPRQREFLIARAEYGALYMDGVREHNTGASLERRGFVTIDGWSKADITELGRTALATEGGLT